MTAAPAAARRASPAGRRVAAQTAMELRLLLRNGESLLVTFGIPLVLLVFFSLIDVLPHGQRRPVTFLVPGVLALSVMSTAMVALGIATGFERYYLVLKRLGATPLRRGELILAKVLAVSAIEVVQILAVLVIAVLGLGYDPAPGQLWLAPVSMALATAAFAGIGLAMAGRLRALATLGLVNALYLALLLVGGIFVPLDRLPDALAAIARLLPSAALTEVLRAAFARSDVGAARALAVLAVWAVGAVVLASRTFRWE